MKLPSIPFVVLDTETTGIVPRTHRVIEFASIEVRRGKVQTEYEQLFHHADVPPVVQVLTRISAADLNGKPALADHLEDICRRTPDDALLVGQNINFDIGMLKGEGIDLSGRPHIDTSMLASLVFPELESYSLGYLSTVLKLNHDPPHRALGDARATLELLEKCWERLLELPDNLHDIANAIMKRGPKGYKMLFDVLPRTKSKNEPAWMHWKENLISFDGKIAPIALKMGNVGTPNLIEEPLDPAHLQSVMEGARTDVSIRHWIAVKSLRPTMKNLQNIHIIHPPHSLIDANAVIRFSQQKEYTADEATLALKLAWYEPHRRDQLSLHGGEDAVWNGKLSCTAESKAYLDQFNNLPPVVLIDHRELLEFLQNPDHPGSMAMAGAHHAGRPIGTGAHVIIDDASMLEDTATKAYGWFFPMDDLRAASQGDDVLTRFSDTLQLWIEKIRQFQDIRYLTNGDLSSADSKGLRLLIDDVLQKECPTKLLQYLNDLRNIMQIENLAHRIAWIEQKPNGNQLLQSVPEHIGQLLQENLFKRFPTTLLIPQGSANMLPEILPSHGHELRIADDDNFRNTESAIRNLINISFELHPNLEDILTTPPAGKTVILLPGKGAIEDLYVKYAEALEEKGVAMICQGMNGGMGRMQSEFLSADGPAFWLTTPWMFEGTNMQKNVVNHLIMKTLPFDHPNHPILSRRSQHYRDPFNEYSLPRLMHRLFRLLRAFARIRTPDGDVRLLDERITTKAYGKIVRSYLEQFSSSGTPPDNIEQAAPSAETKERKEIQKKKAAPKKKTAMKDQLALF